MGTVVDGKGGWSINGCFLMLSDNGLGGGKGVRDIGGGGGRGGGKSSREVNSIAASPFPLKHCEP